MPLGTFSYASFTFANLGSIVRAPWGGLSYGDDLVTIILPFVDKLSKLESKKTSPCSLLSNICLVFKEVSVTTRSFSLITTTGNAGISLGASIRSFPSILQIGTLFDENNRTATLGITLEISHVSAENVFSGNSGIKIVRLGIISTIIDKEASGIYFRRSCSTVFPILFFLSLIIKYSTS